MAYPQDIHAVIHEGPKRDHSKLALSSVGLIMITAITLAIIRGNERAQREIEEANSGPETTIFTHGASAVLPHRQKGAKAASTVPAKAPAPISFTVYSDFYNGRHMANGVAYDPKKLTCACNLVKLGTLIEINWRGKSLRLPVTDRLAKRFSATRIDLSMAAWNHIYGGKSTVLKGGTWRVAK